MTKLWLKSMRVYWSLLEVPIIRCGYNHYLNSFEIRIYIYIYICSFDIGSYLTSCTDQS